MEIMTNANRKNKKKERKKMRTGNIEWRKVHFGWDDQRRLLIITIFITLYYFYLYLCVLHSGRSPVLGISILKCQIILIKLVN